MYILLLNITKGSKQLLGWATSWPLGVRSHLEITLSQKKHCKRGMVLQKRCGRRASRGHGTCHQSVWGDELRPTSPNLTYLNPLHVQGDVSLMMMAELGMPLCLPAALLRLICVAYVWISQPGGSHRRGHNNYFPFWFCM